MTSLFADADSRNRSNVKIKDYGNYLNNKANSLILLLNQLLTLFDLTETSYLWAENPIISTPQPLLEHK